MRLISIDNIRKQDSHIYYRRVYFADAFYECKGSRESKQVKFIIEVTPLGEKHISIDFLESLNYPALSLMIAIKRCVIDLDMKGELP
ncbi:hypothetical protein baBA2_000178 [Borrelia anserina]|uniref:Uncharacterized protein n=2 Tax=Borrelia anserina TaxID=143 RepID=W5SND3_BORAN|nr:hypothetical protein [Borrelia anserina]AHH08148.1 Hypothetical protein BAN_0096800 [Borrelia anserina BA2]AHH08845.1 Hypothetical protein BAN_0096801 [Borrelia anserina BA2]APR64682.1 hypothetical protein N187_00885 [Borrelia anserina Es]UPA06596.1 hypothetical protein baBA2_000178 [Borrelia anserina]